ncbi:hypothetical protein DL770_001581 [Monosporascus sp. CRB-9-2]|nr:hypothetical protein DL770_001581 [Monosporascus sp. CRB-9-2]
MASVCSASPSGQSFPRGESESEWEQIESNPASSVGFYPSPSSGSLGSWGIVGYSNQVQPSPPAASPLNLDADAQHGYPTSFPDQSDRSVMSSTGIDEQYLAASDGQQLLASHGFFLQDQFASSVDASQYYSAFQESMAPQDFSALPGLEDFDMPSQVVDLGIPSQFRTQNDVPPWDPTNLKNDSPSSMTTNAYNFTSQAPAQPSPSDSSRHSSPTSHVKEESGKTPSPIRKIKGKAKIEKRRAESPGKFVIMTPNLINAQSGKPNPFECFEAMRTTQRGRKGPLANETKESALQCDKERPCRNCKKLSAQVPQIICWQFQDFLPVLFPDFIREHFKKDAIASFINENVQHFKVGGEEQLCSVELFSGFRFQSTLTVPASFFTAKTAEVLQHWHLNAGVNQIDLQSRGSAPIGINPENNTQREELKKRTREYVHNLTFEPLYAEQVTDWIRSTALPCKVLKIVQRYAEQSKSPMVKRALSIYVMHYVLTRQLCLTNATILRLQHTNLVPQNSPWVTTRILNRQVKAMLDELLLKETQALFDGFSRSLKPKLRREWAPCAAAFLVLCLFMEAVETAADTFVISQNEVGIRSNGNGKCYDDGRRREFALSLCRDVENLPFRQFAYQFHHVYQTHSRDAAAARPFNPLVDEEFARPGQGDLDDAAVEMVTGLRELLSGENWRELDFLVADQILPNEETHPYPRDVSLNYTGRLLARFLLSFTDEKYLFDGQY